MVLKALLSLQVKEQTARNGAVTGSTVETPDQPRMTHPWTPSYMNTMTPGLFKPLFSWVFHYFQHASLSDSLLS